MYYYIYDSFLSERKYRRKVAAIENSLTDLGIAGERDRVTPIRQVADLVKLGAERGIKTIVIVGNDYTFTKAVNAGAVLGIDPAQVVFGIIPFGEPNKIARMLGISADMQAAKELAARKIETLDIGQVNRRFFISSVEVGFEPEHKTRKDVVQENISTFKVANRLRKFKPQPIKILIDGEYRINCDLFNASVVNLTDSPLGKKIIDPTDQKLTVNVVPFSEDLQKKTGLIAKRDYARLPNASLFSARTVRIEGPRNMKVSTDGVLYDNLPVDIGIVPQTLRVIVGKNRGF